MSSELRRFIVFWPLLASWAYLVTALWGAPVFNNRIDHAYGLASFAIAFIGVLATIFWRIPLLRNVMASIALGRSFSTIVFGLLSTPHLSFSATMRLTGPAALGVLFFALALVELPYLKAMRNELR